MCSFLIFARLLLILYSLSGESDEWNGEEYDKLGSESGSAGEFGTGLGR